MTMRYGLLTGQAYNPANTAKKPVGFGLERATNDVLFRDVIELAAAPANDTIFLGKYPSNTILDPYSCRVWFDDLGTGITMDVGDSSNPDGLADGVDVATAAGSFNLLVTVGIENYYKPLWAQLGYASDPGGQIELYGTILGAAATGTVAAQVMGVTR